MEQIPLNVAVQTALDAVAKAVETRKELRRNTKPGDPDREEVLDGTLRMLEEAMRPIRSAIGKMPWEPIPDDLEFKVRAASAALQYQRRQLKKMVR